MELSYAKLLILVAMVQLLLTLRSLDSFGVHGLPTPDQATAHLSTPNMESGMERLLGLGVVMPYPYFQKPKYRYPVYDREGRGYLVYGYGGKQVFRYSKFDKKEGHH